MRLAIALLCLSGAAGFLPLPAYPMRNGVAKVAHSDDSKLCRRLSAAPIVMADEPRKGLWGAGEPPKCV